jgi:1-acyl-sn-glycerol-3-phosphate acyltransferase
MDLWFFPLENPIWNTFIRAIVIMVVLIFGFKWSLYNAYWVAIVHDAISLIAIRSYV